MASGGGALEIGARSNLALAACGGIKCSLASRCALVAHGKHRGGRRTWRTHDAAAMASALAAATSACCAQQAGIAARENSMAR